MPAIHGVASPADGAVVQYGETVLVAFAADEVDTVTLDLFRASPGTGELEFVRSILPYPFSARNTNNTYRWTVPDVCGWWSVVVFVLRPLTARVRQNIPEGTGFLLRVDDAAQRVATARFSGAFSIERACVRVCARVFAQVLIMPGRGYHERNRGPAGAVRAGHGEPRDRAVALRAVRSGHVQR